MPPSRSSARPSGRPRGRRLLRATAVAVATGVVLGGAAISASEPVEAAPRGVRCPGEPGAVTRLPASVLADAVGVGVHLGYEDTPYADVDRVEAALRDLGVRHVRDDYFLGDQAQTRALQQLGRAGVGLDLITGNPGDPSPETYVRSALLAFPGMVEAFEGPNERDVFQRGDWAPPTWERQVDLWEAVRATSPAGGPRPLVLGPALAFADRHIDQLRAQGPLGEVSDVANAHTYPGGLPPSNKLRPTLEILDRAYDGRPVMVTETGYHDATASRTPHPAVSPRVEASYLSRLPLEHLRAGVARSYLYELLDQGADPRDRRRERSFGLLRSDFGTKPAYLALRRVLRLAEDERRTDLPGSAVRLTCPRGADDVRHLVLPRSDGRTVVLVWRDVSVWDVERLRPSRVPALPVTLRLGESSPLRVYAPTLGDAPVASLTTRRVALRLGGDVVAVVVGGGRAREDLARPLPLRRVQAPQQVLASPRRGGLVVRWRTTGPAARGVVARSVTVGDQVLVVPRSRSGVRVGGLRSGRTVTVQVRAVRTDGTSRVVRRSVTPR